MNVFQMSISASVLILTIVVIRALAIHKIPKKTFLVLWGVALLRLSIPFSIPSPFSIYTLIDKTAGFFTKITDTQAATSAINALPKVDYIDLFAATTTLGIGTQMSPVMIVWVIGMISCALFFLVTHLRCRREYMTTLPIDNDFINEWLQRNKTRRSIQIRQSDSVKAPMTYGIWKPVILFPKTIDWKDEAQIRYVLTHELTHIKRFDILSKWLLASALCVHWFNPLVWVMYILANRDIELSCDERVVWTFGDREKSAYALTLIGLEEKKRGFYPLCTNFAKNAMEERITSIMMFKRKSVMAIIIAVFIVAATTTAFATGVLNAHDDSSYPDGYKSQYSALEEDNNSVNGPREENSVEGTLIAVNRNDKDRYTKEQWSDILEKVETGEILFFETHEEEVEYFHGKSSN